jgi:hypothetical protein
LGKAVLSQSPEAVQELTFAVAHSTVVPGKIPAVAVLLDSCNVIAAVLPVGVLTGGGADEVLLDDTLLVDEPELPELPPELLPELEPLPLELPELDEPDDAELVDPPDDEPPEDEPPEDEPVPDEPLPVPVSVALVAPAEAPLPVPLLPQPAAASIAAAKTTITGSFILHSPFHMLPTVFRISTDVAICLRSATRQNILKFGLFSQCLAPSKCDGNRKFANLNCDSNRAAGTAPPGLLLHCTVVK